MENCAVYPRRGCISWSIPQTARKTTRRKHEKGGVRMRVGMYKLCAKLRINLHPKLHANLNANLSLFLHGILHGILHKPTTNNNHYNNIYYGTKT